MNTKIASAVGAVVFLVFPLITSAQTTTPSTDLQALITQLQAQVQSLQAQIEDLNAQLQSVKIELKFTRVLAKGATGEDVKQLQEFLSTFPDVYPEGLVTGYFGPLTEAAIERFQEKQGIVNSGSPKTTGFGQVGPKTTSKINELLSTGAGASGVIPPGLLSALGIQTQTTTITASTTATSTSAATIATTPATTITIQPVQPPPVSPGSISPPSSTSPPTATTTTTATTTSATSDTTPPSVPAGLNASVVSLSQIDISWTASTDNVAVTGYKIYRAGTQIGTQAASALTTISYSDTGVQDGYAAVYIYTVAAYDAAGNTSAQSASPPTIITSITPYSPIPPNEHLISSITIQWNTARGDNTYRRIWRRFGGGDWWLVGQVQGNTFLDLNIGAGTYDYKLNTCSTYTSTASYGIVTDGCGPDSNTMTATLTMGSGGSDTTPPSTPTGLKVWPDPYNRNFFSWTASTDDVGVAGYNIYRNGTYLISAGNVASEDDYVFSPLTTYSYTVAAYDAAGNVSPQSSSVSPTTPVSMTTATSNLASVLVALRSLSSLLHQLLSMWPI